MKALVSLVLMLGSLSAHSTILYKNTKILNMPVMSKDTVYKNFAKEVLPSEMPVSDRTDAVMYKIVDNSLYYFYKNSGLSNTSIGRAAESVEKKMKADIDLGADKNNVKHKMSFKVFATQALAKLEYFGWFNASINYDMKSAQTKAEIIEKLSDNKNISLSHAIAHGENNSHVSFNLDW